MTSSRKSRSAFVALVAAAATLTACAPTTPQTPTSTTSAGSIASGSITVGMEAGSPHESFYREKAADFTKATGIQVQILAVPHDNMHQQFLSDAISGAGAYDVLTVDQPWVSEFAGKGYLVPLDDRLSGGDRADFGNTLDTETVGGKVYGLPFLVHNLVLYYRPSLLKAAGYDSPPTSWEQYREIAKATTDPSTGVWGTMIPGNRDGEVATRIESYIQQAGGDIVGADGKPAIDNQAARDALAMMTAIQFHDKSSPEGLHDLSAIQGQFLEGKVAMVAVWPYLWAMAIDPSQSKISQDVAVALNPGNPDQVATNFSWGFGVSSASKNKIAAWEWVKWATSSDVLTAKAVEQLSPVPRASAMKALESSPTLTERDRAALEVFGQSVAKSKTMPMVAAYPQYQDAMAEAVSAVMSQQATPDQALKTAQQAMEQTAGQ